MKRSKFLSMKTDVENILYIFSSEYKNILDAVVSELNSDEFLVSNEAEELHLLPARDINRHYTLVFNKKELLKFLEENRSSRTGKIWLHDIDFRTTSFAFEYSIKNSVVIDSFLTENNYKKEYDGDSLKRLA